MYHPPYVNIEKRINSEFCIKSSIIMKKFFIFLLIAAVNAAETSTLQRKTRSRQNSLNRSNLNVGSVVIENQTSDLLKVIIEPWDGDSIMKLK